MHEIDQPAYAYFRRTPLRHIVHLKYLAHHPGQFDTRYIGVGGSEAALLSGCVEVTAWDRGQYPMLDLMLLPSASDAVAAAELVRLIQTEFSVPTTRTLFKFCDPFSRDALTTAFRLYPTRTYLSFTFPEDVPAYEKHPGVVVGSLLDDARAALYQQNGYMLDELEAMVARGALTFALYEKSDLISVCLAYCNFERVWEIGGVRTVDHARNQGAARRVVETALHELRLRELIPRYHVEDVNAPSIGLAQSLGLVECTRIEHFVTASPSAASHEDALA